MTLFVPDEKSVSYYVGFMRYLQRCNMPSLRRNVVNENLTSVVIVIADKFQINSISRSQSRLPQGMKRTYWAHGPMPTGCVKAGLNAGGHWCMAQPLAPGLKACFFPKYAMKNATAIRAMSAQGKYVAPALLRSMPPTTPPLAIARFHAVVTIA